MPYITVTVQNVLIVLFCEGISGFIICNIHPPNFYKEPQQCVKDLFIALGVCQCPTRVHSLKLGILKPKLTAPSSER